MTAWTPALIAGRLIEAADVLKRLPEERVQGYFSTWPQALYEFSDLVGQDSALARPAPSSASITRMEETLTWIAWLEQEDRKLVWARAEGTPWKPICWRFGISRATASRRWEYGLSVIAWRLNGRKPSVKRSRAFLVQRVRAASSPS